MLEIRDTQSDVFERALIARPFRAEQRQLAAPRVGADEREPVLPVDDVHPGVLRQELHDRLAILNPEGDVIQGLGLHVASVPVPYRSTSPSAYGHRRPAAAAACSSASARARRAAWPRC